MASELEVELRTHQDLRVGDEVVDDANSVHRRSYTECEEREREGRAHVVVIRSWRRGRAFELSECECRVDG